MINARTGTADAEERGRFPPSQGLLLFGLISLLGNVFGSVLRYPDVGSAVLFPPYAALTAALIVSPRREWVWYILVGGVTHALAHLPEWSPTWVLFADVANVTRALTAAVLLRHFFHGPPRLDGIRALVLFVLSAVIVAPAVGATLGAANVVLHGGSTGYWRPWRGWFMSSALTGLTMLPVFVAAVANGSARRFPADRRRLGEVLLLAGALIITCAVAFLLPIGSWELPLLFYAPLPVLIWVALRFGPDGASLALTVVTLAAIWGVDRGTGPFLSPSPYGNVLALQFFVVLTTLPVLCIAAVASARHRAVQLYRALLASLVDHVAILDARGVVLEVNESWRRFENTADGHHFDRVYAGNNYLAACRTAADQGDATAARALAGVTSVLNRSQRIFDMEYERGRDGRREWYTMRAEALERSDGGAVVTRANVSARRRGQIELDEQRREVSHLARVAVLGQLSGALAHELSQPLASILGNAEAARHLLRRQPADLGELGLILEDIIKADRRAGDVMHRLRALLKRGETRLHQVDPGELLNDVLELAHAELIARHVAATASVEPGLPPVLGDRVQLQQVMLNLILNACEAMSATVPTDRALLLSVRSAATDASATSGAAADVLFEIRDCGTGIPPGLVHRLFEPFVTTKPEGLGLGLSIAQTIVAAHGGRLWAENNAAGRGATVHCLLASALSSSSAGASDPSRLLGAESGPASRRLRA